MHLYVQIIIIDKHNDDYNAIIIILKAETFL